MKPTADPAPRKTSTLPLEPHPSHLNCIVCREREQAGMGMRFEGLPDGSVQGEFGCEPDYQGYADCVHGGVIATLHDAAMVNCLMHHGATGMTAKMAIRYHKPLELSSPARIHAWIDSANHPLYRLVSEIAQHGVLRSRAESLFFARNRNAPESTV